jgi:hypothetical protein
MISIIGPEPTITNDVSDYVTSLVRIAYIICNQNLYRTVKLMDYESMSLCRPQYF